MRRYVTLAVLLITFLVGIEGTVVSTAMPGVVKDLGGMELYPMVFSAYLSCVTLTTLVWGRLADRWGAGRCYQLSTALFLVGSAACGQCHSMKTLIAWRAVQGLGGGGLTPLGQTLLAKLYDAQGRAKIQTYLVTVFFLSTISGPVLGGGITQHLGWRLIFYLNLPFGLAGLLCLFLFLDRQEVKPSGKSFDFVGLAVFALALSAFLAWCRLFLWQAGVACVCLSVVLALHQRGRSSPFLPTELSVYPIVLSSLGVVLTVGMGVWGAISYLPLYFQSVGQTNQASGASMIPLGLSWVGSAAFSPKMALRRGYRYPVQLAVAAMLGGYLMLAGLPPAVWVGWVGGALIGLSGGLSFAPLTLGVQYSVPRELLGSATSAMVFLRMLGATAGTALLGLALPDLGLAFQIGLAAAILSGLLAFRLRPEKAAEVPTPPAK